LTPNRGDILHLQFDPASGKEMIGNHFCLVVSPKSFNAKFKLAMVCPISGGAAHVAREAGFLVSLMEQGLRTDGSVLIHQLKSQDWATRNAKFVEKVPATIMQEVLDCLVTVFEDD
jgi:mRNA interferase ChpB